MSVVHTSASTLRPAYYPETNVLIPLEHHGADAQTPAANAVPIRLERSAT